VADVENWRRKRRAPGARCSNRSNSSPHQIPHCLVTFVRAHTAEAWAIGSRLLFLPARLALSELVAARPPCNQTERLYRGAHLQDAAAALLSHLPRGHGVSERREQTALRRLRICRLRILLDTISRNFESYSRVVQHGRRIRTPQNLRAAPVSTSR
jgi:hypothetical protein